MRGHSLKEVIVGHSQAFARLEILCDVFHLLKGHRAGGWWLGGSRFDDVDQVAQHNVILELLLQAAAAKLVAGDCFDPRAHLTLQASVVLGGRTICQILVHAIYHTLHCH